MRRPTLFFIAAAAGVGLGLFHLKYQVMNLEQEHRRIERTIRETDEAIHILKAEWAHLNDPKRLQALCERHLTISPVQGTQMVSLQSVAEDGTEGTFVYDRKAMDDLVADLVSDVTLAALNE